MAKTREERFAEEAQHAHRGAAKLRAQGDHAEAREVDKIAARYQRNAKGGS